MEKSAVAKKGRRIQHYSPEDSLPSVVPIQCMHVECPVSKALLLASSALLATAARAPKYGDRGFALGRL
jgi:hypothetical protein